MYADLVSRSTDVPRVNLIKQVDGDDKTYVISDIKSNSFEHRYFATYRENPTLPDIDIIRTCEASRDIIELKRRTSKSKLENKNKFCLTKFCII